jgi:hypothetical protein
MKKLLLTLTILLLTTGAYAAYPNASTITLLGSGKCTQASDNVTITCETSKSEGSYLSVDYTSGTATSVIITPKHSYIGTRETTYYNLADPDTLASAVTSNVLYNVMADIAYKMPVTKSQTWKVMYPVRAKYIQYNITFTGDLDSATKVLIYSEPISKPLF